MIGRSPLRGPAFLNQKLIAMKTLFEKACEGRYLEKYNKRGDLLREAEQFDSGVWIVWEYPSSKTNIQGEYSEQEFKSIRRRYF